MRLNAQIELSRCDVVCVCVCGRARALSLSLSCARALSLTRKHWYAYRHLLEEAQDKNEIPLYVSPAEELIPWVEDLDELDDLLERCVCVCVCLCVCVCVCVCVCMCVCDCVCDCVWVFTERVCVCIER